MLLQNLLRSDHSVAHPRTRSTFVFFAALLALLPIIVAPQAARAQATRLRLQRVWLSSSLNLNLTYAGPDGSIAADRASSEFKLQVDSSGQIPAEALAIFDPHHDPIFVIAVVQISSSLPEHWLSQVKAGFHKLSEAVSFAPDGGMGVLAYAGGTQRLLELGFSSKVDGALSKLVVESKATKIHMLDAVRTAIEMLATQQKGGLKLIVLVSDGADIHNDKKDFTDVAKRASQAGINIDTIGYNKRDPAKLSNLAELAKGSNGIERVAKSELELERRFEQVLAEIQKEYILRFPLGIIGDDKEHTFQVTHEAGGSVVYSNVVSQRVQTDPEILGQARFERSTAIAAGKLASVQRLNAGLAAADKIQVSTFRYNSGGDFDAKGEADKSVIKTGPLAQQIANDWSGLKLNCDEKALSFCFQPAYEIRFFANNTLILSIKPCWNCRNVAVSGPQAGHMCAFDVNTESAKSLRARLRQLFPGLLNDG